MQLQAISNALYALALLQCRTGPLIAGLTIAVDSTAPHMDAQQLSNVLWALARLDVALPDTLLLAIRELSSRQTNSQDISNSIWALAHLDCTPQKQLQVLLQRYLSNFCSTCCSSCASQSWYLAHSAASSWHSLFCGLQDARMG
jgi:hypothetical protein